LCSETSSKEMIMTLGNLIKDYPEYRKIRSDGNCFYRAIGFNWIRNCDITKFDEVFPAFDHLSLAVCKLATIP
jgi:hypothetical protein